MLLKRFVYLHILCILYGVRIIPLYNIPLILQSGITLYYVV